MDKSHPNHKWWTLVTVALGLLMVVLDGNVVNLAIPKILQDFGATLSQMQWVNNAYLLTFAIFLITFGRLGDEMGRKKLFITGMVVFLAGSLMAGLAGNTTQLIIFRILQGFGGAAMMPATLSLISATFEKKERGIAMGVWGGVAGLSIALGPIIGGFLTESGLGHGLNTLLHVTQFWRYVFYINLPIGIAAIVMAFLVIQESRDSEATHKYDIPGIILSAVTIFCLTYGFIQGPSYGWWKPSAPFMVAGHSLQIGSLSVIPGFFALAVIFGALLIWWERRVKVDPLVDIKLFSNRNFWVGNIGAAVLSFGMMGSFFLLPLFLESILGYSPKHTGTSLLPLAITMMIAAPLAGKISDRIGAKWGVTVGMLLMSVGVFMLAHFHLDTTTANLIWPYIVTGLGMGFAMAPITNITLLDIPPDEVGGASGVLSTARQIGSVMGIAILGAYLQSVMPAKIEANVNAIAGLPTAAKTAIVQMAKSGEFTQESADPVKLQGIVAKVLVADSGQPATAPTAAQIAQMQKLGAEISVAGRQGFVDAVNETLKISMFIALLGALVSLLFHNRRPDKDAEHNEPGIAV